MTSRGPRKNRRRQIVGTLNRLILTLLLLLSFAGAAQARVASIETTAPLRDYSPESVAIAFQEAAELAVRGAIAMGLSRILVYEARVMTDMVAVQVLATDEDLEDEDAGLGEKVGPGLGRLAGEEFAR